MHIRYVGPFDEVEIAASGDVVARGATVEVPAEIAGRPPKGDRFVDAGAANPVRNPDFDPGEGLLAQPDAWQPAKASKDPTGDSAGIADAPEEL